jgi:hypothetical protein
MTTRDVEEAVLEALLDIALDQKDRHSAAERLRAIDIVLNRSWLLEEGR